MTEDFLSPAALEDEAHHRAKLEAARLAAEEAARVAPPPRIIKRKVEPTASAQREALADVIGKAIAHERKAHRDQIAQLDRRLTALEARPTLAVRGVWKPRASYEPGDAVSDKSALWVCTSAVTGERPGASSCWRLAVKAGEVPA